MLFQYKAKNIEGKIKEGKVEAASRLELARRLRDDGFYIVDVEEAGSAADKKKSFLQKFATFDIARLMEKLKGISVEEKMIFSRNLAVMISSGITITRALEVLQKQTESPTFKDIIGSISQDIKKGQALSVAISKYPKVFDKLYSSMIQAGEAAGNMDEALNTLAEQLEKQHDLKSRIRGAMFYPAVIVVAMSGIGVLMMIMVVPQLNAIFADLDVQLPITTRFIIALSDFIQAFWWLILISIPFGIWGLLKFTKTSTGHKTASWLLLKIPIFKDLTKKINNANFARNLSSLISGGVPILESIEITSDTLGNTYFQESLVGTATQIKKGGSMHSALEAHPKLYTPLMLEMVEVGEESGKLSELLNRVAEFYEEEVAKTTANMSSIIEPILMIIIGTGVGFFAVSVLQPIYGLLGSF